MHDLTQEEYAALLLEHNDFKHNIEELKTRVDKCESQQEAMTNLILSVDRLTQTVGTMIEEQKELKSDVKSLKEAPAKRAEHYRKTVVSSIITTIVGAIIGAVITILISSGGV